ncbi:hypothetical protein EDD37DRAFT_652157 [Exophiala viscosa]|uniref:uncharacterized protein n=1 Tax=Exophiala viscosa TaxID=2486360 RepID=UPI00219E49BA|nr:hypothetical protein EDD37DRAFT_652157 [Exophiala viscosa]
MDYSHYPQYYSESISLSNHSIQKPIPQFHATETHTHDTYDTKRVKAIQSTLGLKLNIVLSSVFSLSLMSLASAQSYMQFISLGYAAYAPDNSRTAAVNAVIAVYGAITGMATRMAVTKCLNLVSIKALTTNGKFIWGAKTWAYMSHANGPWYTLGPLFAAGLTATAVISILPAAVVDAGHYVHLQIAPNFQLNEISCMQGNSISPNVFCTGSALAALLLQSYSVAISGYARNSNGPELNVMGHISSNRSLGYPWYLVNNNLAEYTKYNVSRRGFQHANKTACVWVLDEVPIRCSFLNYTVNDSGLEVKSPYTGQVFSLENSSIVPPQGMMTQTVGSIAEMAGVGVFDSVITAEPYISTAFVCTSRELSEVHVGRYITAEITEYVTYVDIANDTTCEPTYDLPTTEGVRALINDMAGGMYQFASVDGSNTLMYSFSQSYFDINIPMFNDSTSMLEDGMGSFLALMLSNIYADSAFDTPNSPNTTRVNGGLMSNTVGLGKRSRLYAWLIFAALPLLALVTAIFMPLDYTPSWDVMNPMDALATDAIIDEAVAAAKGRSSGIRLGMVDGRIVASNRNLPTRISKGDAF